MTNYEGMRIHSFMLLPNGAGSENVDQSLPVIRISFYHCWIRINETNTVHVSDRRNSMAFIFHMEYTKLVKTVYRNIR